MAEYVVSSSVSGVNAGPGDTVSVVNGGTDTDYTISGGGQIFAEDGGIVSGGTFVYVYTPGVYPQPSNQETILTGGSATGTLVEDGEQIVDGGMAAGTEVYGYPDSFSLPGEQIVENGGIAIQTTVEPNANYFLDGATGIGASQTIEAGGTSSQTSLLGYGNSYFKNDQPEYAPINVVATETVNSGGTAIDTTIGFDSDEYVSAGGSIGGTTTITGITETPFGISPITHSILELNGPSGSGTIDFVHSAGELIVDGLTMPTNEIINIGAASIVDLTSVPESSVTDIQATENQLIVDTTSGQFALNVQDADSRSYFASPDGNGGTEILCFIQGTLILTPTGAHPIEDLLIGDLVVTRWSGLQIIRWIGRQSYSGRFLLNNPAKIPVHIRAGALADHLPASDLHVSPGHSMLIDDRLVLASSLINGITITQDKIPEEVHYFQIELDHHECVVAEGTWSETYAAGDGLRGQFHNVKEFYALYPEHRDPDELVLCAPRPGGGPKLDQVLRPIVLRAMTDIRPGPLSGTIDLIPTQWKVEGWAHDAAHPDLPVLLEVLLKDLLIGTVLACDYRGDLEQAGIGRGRCAFAFSSPVRLAADDMHRLRIRRASDSIEIPMSNACHAQIHRNFTAA